ncbi:1-acyl-sn-glycerol-3-phosphate acyltransferase epsilon-like [Tropilaelaps mercedesae]|uniref:1-acyl-sn-glycerol-3-phosphate acyltransferase epsilon-like n=1 Tax=Tropilaelaps mercedesae TaxID=418985 RepID=A0A1V9XXM9_9ACAR|nr:1-acyl-sn-glycerol-3-phosphate acyltransferase epsilon-like [Tropilaelaps mercedesae]
MMAFPSWLFYVSVAVTKVSSLQPLGNILLQELANGLCQEVHIHLRRIDIKDVPEEENDVREFLVDRFEMKERLLDRFYSTGSLPEKGVQLAAQGRRHLVQSLLIVLLALGLGFTSTGLTWLPYHMLVPAIIGLVHVVHHVYLGR